MIKFFLPILIAILILLATFFLGKDYGAKTELAACQAKEQEVNNVNNAIIVKSVEKRKTNSIIPIDDVWSKLFSKYCSDCKS